MRPILRDVCRLWEHNTDAYDGQQSAVLDLRRLQVGQTWMYGHEDDDVHSNAPRQCLHGEYTLSFMVFLQNVSSDHSGRTYLKLQAESRMERKRASGTPATSDLFGSCNQLRTFNNTLSISFTYLASSEMAHVLIALRDIDIS